MSGPPGVSISLTEAQGFASVGQFLQQVCAPYPITVMRALGSTAPGANVRVPEPTQGDFVVMSSLRDDRLDTNYTTFGDNVVVGSISGTTMTVTSVTHAALAGLQPGNLVIDLGYPSGSILPNTTIVEQLTGSPLGGVGTYEVSVSQTLTSETLYVGTRNDARAAEWVCQLDVHGPNSMNNVNTIDALFRSEYATDLFASTGYWVSPLYADTAHQLPFENAEAEVELRWVMELHLQVTPIVTTPQQFATSVKVTPVDVETL